MVGLAVGLSVGLAIRYGLSDQIVNGETITGTERSTQFGETWFKPLGDAFVRLIKMLIVPLIATTLISGVTAMGDPKKLGSLGARTISGIALFDSSSFSLNALAIRWQTVALRFVLIARRWEPNVVHKNGSGLPSQNTRFGSWEVSSADVAVRNSIRFA